MAATKFETYLLGTQAPKFVKVPGFFQKMCIKPYTCVLYSSMCKYETWCLACCKIILNVIPIFYIDLSFLNSIVQKMVFLWLNIYEMWVCTESHCILFWYHIYLASCLYIKFVSDIIGLKIFWTLLLMFRKTFMVMSPKNFLKNKLGLTLWIIHYQWPILQLAGNLLANN
jgi:hypothetical protein